MGHACYECGEVFENVLHLECHMSAHEDKPHRCDLCGKRFAIPSSLTRHQKMHSTGLKTLACNFCDKKFSYVSTLTRHYRLTHGGDSVSVEAHNEALQASLSAEQEDDGIL